MAARHRIFQVILGHWRAETTSVGDCMFSPRGSVHSFSNPYQETARALIMISPDIGAQYFRDVGVVINAGGAPDLRKLMAVMSRYGLVPAASAR